MMNEPLVTIIVPTYNAEKYIDECMESLINQNYGNIEIIVIDNGSTDATPVLLSDYETAGKIIHNSKNQGQGTAKNQGLDMASGEYVWFVEADDYIEVDAVKNLIQFANQKNADVIRFNGRPFKDHLSYENLTNAYQFDDMLVEGKVYKDDETLEVNQKAYSPFASLYFIKTKYLKDNNIRFPENIIHEDEVFVTHLLVKLGLMTYLNLSLYNHRYKMQSVMEINDNVYRLQSFDSSVQVYKHLSNLYNHDQYNTLQKTFIKRPMLSVYSDLKNADVPSIKKKVLKDFTEVTIKDKLYLKLFETKNKQ